MQYHWVENFEAERLPELYDLYQNQWWTQGRSFDDFITMLENSDLAFACYVDKSLAGFARVLTDTIFKAIIFDLIVVTQYQSQGIGHKLVDYIINHPKLTNVKSFELYCPESIAGFYEKAGFQRSDSIFLQKKSINMVAT